ncbi:hypothetical protein QCA50_010228 [Cerrena zonata]|uniref:Uncharacterized protein n=1 Tax=Cerrena zonata TaxID=2478898 RepID=A0AAW0G9K5_9APHY
MLCITANGPRFIYGAAPCLNIHGMMMALIHCSNTRQEFYGNAWLGYTSIPMPTPSPRYLAASPRDVLSDYKSFVAFQVSATNTTYRPISAGDIDYCPTRQD